MRKQTSINWYRSYFILCNVCSVRQNILVKTITIQNHKLVQQTFIIIRLCQVWRNVFDVFTKMTLVLSKWQYKLVDDPLISFKGKCINFIWTLLTMKESPSRLFEKNVLMFLSLVLSFAFLELWVCDLEFANIYPLQVGTFKFTHKVLKPVGQLQAIKSKKASRLGL